MSDGQSQQDIESIKELIDRRNERYAHRGGAVRLAGIEGGTVRIAPSGFCWR